MNYCRFCGKELVNGQCDCEEFLNQTPNATTKRRLFKDPLFITSPKVNLSSVSGFISSVRDLSGMSEPTGNQGDPYEYNVPIVPDCIAPEENEIVVKQYNIAKLRTRLKFMKAEGRLMVTNRRVLFRAAGTSLTGNLLQEHQFNLDELAGLEIHKDYKFSLLSFFGCMLLLVLTHFLLLPKIIPTRINNFALITTFLLGVVSIVPVIMLYKRFWIKLFSGYISCTAFSAIKTCGTPFMILYILSLIMVIALIIIVCFVPNLVLKIKTKGATGALVIGSQKSLLQRQTGDEYSGFAEVMPWEDTVMAINELGTLIDDLQKHGDYAIEKWS